jgi:predicted NAD/FAD-binding protein
MRLAVIGTGISGLASAWLLRDVGHLTLYEANDYVGGHTHTVDVEVDSGPWAVDTGFIVFNPKTYPNLLRLFRKLGVAWQDSDMSFSVRCEKTGLEYCPSRLDTLFAQRRNLFRRRFWRMIREIFRFRREMRDLLASPDETLTLEEYLRKGGYSRMFVEKFLIPMGAAIWSADPKTFASFPACRFVRFFANHLFLERRQPPWLTVKGGSREYVRKICRPFADSIRLGCKVVNVRRTGGKVEVTDQTGRAETYDEVILGVHSDQALALLDAPTKPEREILSAIAYQANDVLLHTDASLLPLRRKVWASWNYLIPARDSRSAAVTYYMNRLQALDAPEEFCVTLNLAARIDTSRVLGRYEYSHPVFNPSARQAQLRREEISGREGIHFCGAYWGYGFHEDGLNSALAVGEHFGCGL